MSQTNLRLSLKIAEDLAQRIAAELAPVCERLEIAGSIRRRRETVGDIELVCIARHSPGLIPDVPGVSLLRLALVAMVEKGKLIPAGKNEGERLQKFFIPALYNEGHDLKLEINISDAERWPVELAIKTGPAEFSKRLVTHRRDGGFLPTYCQIKNGWQVWQEGKPLRFESEMAFIMWACGEWIPPEARR